MSKSLKRVIAALNAAGLTADVIELEQARTAAEAAEGAGCHLDQIVKSIVFRGADSDLPVLFLTAGGNRVSARKATALAGEPLGKADAAFIRRTTGFAIGGVAPLGHLTPVRTWFDPALLSFDQVFGAAGTPRHVFAIAPDALIRTTGAVHGDFTEDPS